MTVRCFSIVLVALGMLACDAPVYDRSLILRALADDVIVPGYDALEHDAQSLHASAIMLCAAPTGETLAATQTAWTTAFVSYERTLGHSIGPAREMNAAGEMAFWPVSATAIERNVAATVAIDAHYVDTLGAASKGFLGIEYLLFGGSGDVGAAPRTDAEVVAGLVAVPRRCAYLVGLTDHIERESTTLASAWRPSEGNFAETLATAGEVGNTRWPDQSTALVEVYTQMLDTLMLVKNTKLGIPIGHRTMMPAPDAIESPWASASVAAMQANVSGVRDAWGTGDRSFDALLRSRDPALADTVQGELSSSSAGLQALAAVAEPDRTHTLSDYAAGTDHSVGETAYTRIDAAETTLATDVASRLGLNVAFSDMDGD